MYGAHWQYRNRTVRMGVVDDGGGDGYFHIAARTKFRLLVQDGFSKIKRIVSFQWVLASRRQCNTK